MSIDLLKTLVLSTLNPPMNVTLVTDLVGLKALESWAEEEAKAETPTVALDTETNVVHDFWPRRVRTIQVGNRSRQFVIDLLAFAGSKDRLIESQGDWGRNNGDTYAEVFLVLDKIIMGNRFLKLGVNLSFEYEVIHWNFGRRIWHLFSCDRAERVIEAGRHSLKDYPFYSMEQMFARYFGLQIDKSKQGSFDLETPLTQEQIDYAAFDVRSPFSLRDAQMRILENDGLLATNQIEQDAIGSYTDMTLYGWRIDAVKWMARIEKLKAERIEHLKALDAAFIPIVGLKTEAVDHEKIAKAEEKWKSGFEIATKQELDIAADKRGEADPIKKAALDMQLKALVVERKQKKNEARAKCMELTKARTKANKIIPKCEGEAFINYAANPQVLDALHKMGIKVKDMKDDSLLVFNDLPLIKILRAFRKGSKAISTYGAPWVQKWTTKPCKEEGFLHPEDGKLHAIFNQLEAETGRSSSSKPSMMNLPKTDEVRSCFVCDPPERVSDCCGAEVEEYDDGL
jgi:hypothetical protein